MNTKFTISYDGTAFFGSQTQPNKLSVEDRLQEAFKSLNIDTKIILSGRTDRDVHATGQVFNCVLPSYWSNVEKLKEILNRHLGLSIKIRDIKIVDENFHARFSAKKRVYRYLITQKQTNPFNQKYIVHHKNINETLINEAIKEFIGVYDFKYFFKTGSEKENTNREIYDAKFYKYKDIYVFRFEANSYLRSQIRLMVGFLLAISSEKLTLEDLKNQLNLSKHIFKTPALPNGLYLSQIKY